MITFLLLFKHIIKSTLKHCYWLFNLNKIKGLRYCELKFPIKIEGNGNAIMGKQCRIGKNTSLLLGKNTKLEFGNYANIDDGVEIITSNCGSLITGENFAIARSSRLYIQNNWQFNDNVTISTNCAIFSREKGLYGQLLIGNNSHIADNCIIDVSENITIMDNVAIGPNCIMFTHDHTYNDLSIPAWAGEKTSSPIMIGANSWIGSGVTILPGVTIGNHVVGAAGAIVTRDIPDFSVWAGIPAKQIKSLIEC